MPGKIALIGATGRIGSKILEELLRRGHTVTAISRHPDKTPALAGVTAAAGDFTSPAALAGVLRNHAAVISAASFIPGRSADLIAAVRQSGVKRLIVVGGAASLEVAPGKRVIDTIQLPPEWAAPVQEGIKMLALLREVTDLDWTFFSPAMNIGPGERTGKFRLGADQLVKDAEGNSRISYDDYAIALVDELERGAHIKRRFTIAY
jgi:putative NADH-flavin reductase